MSDDKLRELARQLESEIAEHDKVLAQRQQMAGALQAQLADCARDAMSRQGAKVQAICSLNKVRELLGQPPLDPSGAEPLIPEASPAPEVNAAPAG